MDTVISGETIDQRDYEIALLLPQEELLPDILRVLSQHKIEIKSEGSVKKIRLAYDIAKTKEAYFVFFHVSAAPGDIKLLEANLRTNTHILRFLIIRLFETKAERDEATKRSGPGRPSYRRQVSSAQPSAEPRQPKAISNEALEKKIEEILQ